MAKRFTQNQWVLGTLRSGIRLTPLVATQDMGIMRLGARIYDLRQEGWDIQTRIVTVRNRFGEQCRVAEYYMELGK